MVYLESLDIDSKKRFVHPVIIESSTFINVFGGGYYNNINAYMDHEWITFYPSLEHTARFPFAAALRENYTITFTGTRPKKMRLEMISDVNE